MKTTRLYFKLTRIQNFSSLAYCKVGKEVEIWELFGKQFTNM